ncbi:MAG TPA: hypothetical protein VFI04_04775 [Gaiellaceae bacterium]|nr:hypothetical protein [Gaiellaceae bacterium]
MRVVERPAAGDPAGAIVFLHGYWGIPDEFAPFLDKLDPERRLQGYLPQAPTHVGEGRYSWEGSGAELEEWFDALPQHVVLELPLPPVLIAHGTHDEPVPVEHARAARERLVAAGADVRFLETDIDHRIDPAVVPELRRFVAEVL